jgi:arginine deiminase
MEAYLLSDDYKKTCIEKMDVEQLVEVVLTRPTILLQKADKDTELLVTNYTYEPLVNLIFCRDQQITTANGVVMGRPRSPIRQREVEVMQFCFKKLGVPIIGRITSPGTLEGGDFFPCGLDLAMLGIGLRSNMEAAQYLLDNDLFGTKRVAIVKDYFDQHQQRMHLDTVFNVIAPRVCLMLDTIQGESSPQRRLVDEYVKDDVTGKYVLHRHDVEFYAYVSRDLGWTVISVTNDMQIAYGCNGLNLGNNTLITVDRNTAKFIARTQLYQGKIIVVDFSNNTNMFGSVHCCSQVISRRSPASTPSSQQSVSGSAHSGELHSNHVRRQSLEVPSPTNIHPHQHTPYHHPVIAPSSPTATPPSFPANVASKFLMIAPDNFDVNQATAEDNILMAASHAKFIETIQKKGQGKRDVHAVLLREFAELHRILTVKLGVEVYLFTHEVFHHSPEALFAADWFSTHRAGDLAGTGDLKEKGLVLYPMKAPSRRNERRPDLLKFLNDMYQRVVNLAPCEQGRLEALDNILDEPSTKILPCKPLEFSSFVMDRQTKTAFAARCSRLDTDALALWATKTGYKRVVFGLDTESQSPHVSLLKSAHHTRVFLAIGSSFALVCTEAIHPSDRDTVKAALAHTAIIDFTLAQCKSLAICGTFEVIDAHGKPTLIISKTAYDVWSEKQRLALKAHGCALEVVKIPEIEQLGGGSVSGIIGSLF